MNKKKTRMAQFEESVSWVCMALLLLESHLVSNMSLFYMSLVTYSLSHDEEDFLVREVAVREKRRLFTRTVSKSHTPPIPTVAHVAHTSQRSCSLVCMCVSRYPKTGILETVVLFSAVRRSTDLGKIPPDIMAPAPLLLLDF